MSCCSVRHELSSDDSMTAGHFDTFPLCICCSLSTNVYRIHDKNQQQQQQQQNEQQATDEEEGKRTKKRKRSTAPPPAPPSAAAATATVASPPAAAASTSPPAAAAAASLTAHTSTTASHHVHPPQPRPKATAPARKPSPQPQPQQPQANFVEGISSQHKLEPKRAIPRRPAIAAAVAQQQQLEDAEFAPLPAGTPLKHPNFPTAHENAVKDKLDNFMGQMH
jgi:hypothetical protein